MTITPLVQRILLALCAALFVGGVIGVATVDEDGQAVDTVQGPTTTTAGVAGGDETTSTTAGLPGSDPGSTVAPAQSTTTAKPVPAGGDPGPNTPPKVGLYRYKSSVDGEASETQIRVEKAPNAGSEERVRLKQTSEEGSQELTLAFRPDGGYVLDTTFTFGTNRIECDWDPDIRNVATPLKAGFEWRFDSRCTAQFNGERADFHLTGSNKVLPAQRVKVGGRDIDVWPIERISKLTIDTKFNTQPVHIEMDSTGVDHFSPRLGLDARSTAKTRNSGPTGSEEHTTERELLNPDPEP